MTDQRRQINEQELPVFFGLIGEGIWYLQHVENALATCLTVKGEIKEIGSVSAEQAERILSKHRKNTLGTSLRLAEEKGILSDDLMLALRAFKEERDWLVHRSLNDNGDDLYLDSARRAVIERLEKFGEQARQLQRLVAQELENFVVSKGASKQWIYRRAIDDIDTKRGSNA